MDEQKPEAELNRGEQSSRHEWLVPVFSLLLAVVFLGLFHETFWSMVSTWLVAETYTHGILILPIVMWLVWRLRPSWRHYDPQPQYLALIPLVLACALWMLGYLVDVLVVQQLALVAMLVAAFVVVMGTTISRILMFPLAFLFFAVPMGEGLVPPLMEYTATVTTLLVKLTGIPVYRDGMFISLPSGNWSVVDACSGIRYLIASLTLGCLFAYINYSSNWKRLVFIIVSAIVPIVANGLRAYMIVMIGHVSDMQLAVGVDHLIYGWVFFGIVMLVLFLIGSRWRDPDPMRGLSSSPQSQPATGVTFNPRQFTSAFILVLLIGLIWPVWVYQLNSARPVLIDNPLSVPNIDGWQKAEQAGWEWHPRSQGADHLIDQFYQRVDGADQPIKIRLHVAYYQVQQQGKEVINTRNRLFNPDFRYWRVASRDGFILRAGSLNTEVTQAVVKGPGNELLSWQWYRVGDYYTANKYMAKVREAVTRLFEGRRDAAIITVSAPIKAVDGTEGAKKTAEALEAFVTEMLPGLEVSLDQNLAEGKGT